MRREKGTAPNSADSARRLAELKLIINSKITKEVQRNMGRPALRNITGRFASSVKLLSLMEGKNTLMAKYTYN